MKRQRWLALLVVLVGCGGDSGSPSGPSPSPTPATYTLTGTVTDQNGAPLGAAAVDVRDGPNAGKVGMTDDNGRYSMASLQAGGFTVRATKQYYEQDAHGVTLTANTTQDFRLRYLPPFSHSGTGDNVFDLPRAVSRVRIQGDYRKNSANFIVYIDGDLVVNELLGTFWSTTHFDGTYLTGGGTVQIEKSSGVAWSFTEVR